MKRIAISLALVVVLVVVLDRLFPPDLSRLSTVGVEIRDQRGRTVALLPAPGGVWRFRTSPDQVAPVFRDLLIAVEDRRFWWHPGVDPLALARAAWQWARTGRVVSGGSTLSMQAARLLEPRPRTIRSKLIEIARAIQLEARHGKQGVLEIWLTLAPFGGNLEGARAGSLAWFGVRPEALEPAQAALLVAIPRRPEALRSDRHPAAAETVRARVLAVGRDAGLFDTVDPAPVPRARIALPNHAPQPLRALAHAAALADSGGTTGRDRPVATASPPVAVVGGQDDMAGKLARGGVTPGGAEPGGIIATTLDKPLQVALERLATERLESLPDRASLAIVIADAESREIRAIHAGSWGDPARAGALDLTRAIRSPGSALKPFIYGLAFQEGLITPDTPIGDLPRQFAGYAPENFGRGFAGTVTAAEALRWSLNLPAVALLDRLGPVRFMSSLKSAGARLVLPAGADPSLPLALGGLGIDLRQLTALYAALATDGRLIPLRLIGLPPMGLPNGSPGGVPAAGAPMAPPGGASGPDRRLLSLGASRIVADVLTHPMPAGGPAGVAWKTGTSWGGRDAWAIGFDSRHVVGVWIGRPDGTPLPGATGLSLALPMLARVFDLLPPHPRQVAGPARVVGVQGGDGPDAPRLLFPPPGAVLSADGPVTIRVMGGRRPLTFMVDGAPLPSEPVRREVQWRPASPGFYRVTVLDADGSAAQARVRVR